VAQAQAPIRVHGAVRLGPLFASVCGSLVSYRPCPCTSKSRTHTTRISLSTPIPWHPGAQYQGPDRTDRLPERKTLRELLRTLHRRWQTQYRFSAYSFLLSFRIVVITMKGAALQGARIGLSGSGAPPHHPIAFLALVSGSSAH
jgi:hypothetical protein